MSTPFVCRRLAAGFNVSAPGANTDILSAAVSPQSTTCALRITVVLATASVFNYTAKQGATTFTCGLNESIALNAGDSYTFVVGANSSTSYNFQVETNGVINVLNVEEIEGAVL